MFSMYFFTAVDCRRVATWLSSCAGRFEENKVGQKRLEFTETTGSPSRCVVYSLVAWTLKITNTQIGWQASISMCRFLWLKNSLGHKVPARTCRLFRPHMRLTCQMCLTSVSDETSDLDSETLITDQTTLRNCQISSLNFTQKRCQPQETQIDYCCGKRVSILWILGWNSTGTKRTEYSDVILGIDFNLVLHTLVL